MRNIDYCIETSLDGFIARPDHAYDFLPTSGPHQDRHLESMVRYDTAVMGRKTYEIGAEAGIMDPNGGLKFYVVSRTLEKAFHPAIEILGDDALARVARLKAEAGKDILISGGARLASGLLSAGLIDVIRVRVIPVAIGSGIPLFAGLGRDVAMRLIGHEAYDNGVAMLTYRPEYPAAAARRGDGGPPAGAAARRRDARHR